MRRSILLISLLVSSAVFFAQNKVMTPQERYVSQFAGLAVEEMYRSGVPASITLAQGLLESRYGLSELAVKGNNHFGIKCHNTWEGRRMYHDDDQKGECFRKYNSPEESFRDHSDFLRYRDRYKFLFDLETTDYKGWAYGLKKAGYATDPAYPAKLIKLIEDYSLYEYDHPRYMAPGVPVGKENVRDGKDAHSAKREQGTVASQDKLQPQDLKEEKQGKSQEKSKKKKKKKAEDQQEIPESPNKIETIKLLDEAPKGEFRFSLSRQMYSQNGVPFVYSARGETYASLAKTFGLFPNEILKFNDLPLGTDMHKELVPGTLIYVQAKKNQAAEGLDKHVLEADDNLWALSQRYGVKLSRIYKMNDFDVHYVPREGDIIRLRKGR